MTPQEVQTIYELLANRVQPSSAREGAAIMQLGAKLVSHFARAQAAQQTTPQPPASDAAKPETPAP